MCTFANDESLGQGTVTTLGRMLYSRHRVKGFACSVDNGAGLIGGGAGCDAATVEMGNVADGRHLGVRIPIGDNARC